MKAFSLLKTVLAMFVLLAALRSTCAGRNRLRVTVRNMTLSAFLKEHGDNIDCPIKLEKKPLKVCGLRLPQIRCMGCEESCGANNGRCAQLSENIGKKVWYRGCVCKKNANKIDVYRIGEH